MDLCKSGDREMGKYYAGYGGFSIIHILQFLCQYEKELAYYVIPQPQKGSRKPSIWKTTTFLTLSWLRIP